MFFFSMQLFHFDVHEDVRTTADATIEKDEVHSLFLPYHYLLFFILMLTSTLHELNIKHWHNQARNLTSMLLITGHIDFLINKYNFIKNAQISTSECGI